MTIDDKIRYEELTYGINRETARISGLLSGKSGKYECLTGEEILPSDPRGVIEQAKFTYSNLGKALEKQRKTIEDQGLKQVEALKALKSEEDQELESIEGIFQKICELMKLKMK